MAIVDIIVMLVLATSAGAGIGGGGLLVVYLTLIKGTSHEIAAALNLLFYILSALSSTIANGIKNKKLMLSPAIFCCTFALPGAFVGAYVREQISEGILRAVFGVMLVAAGIWFGIPNIKNLLTSNKKKKPV